MRNGRMSDMVVIVAAWHPLLGRFRATAQHYGTRGLPMLRLVAGGHGDGGSRGNDLAGHALAAVSEPGCLVDWVADHGVLPPLPGADVAREPGPRRPSYAEVDVRQAAQIRCQCSCCGQRRRSG